MDGGQISIQCSFQTAAALLLSLQHPQGSGTDGQGGGLHEPTTHAQSLSSQTLSPAEPSFLQPREVGPDCPEGPPLRQLWPQSACGTALSTPEMAPSVPQFPSMQKGANDSCLLKLLQKALKTIWVYENLTLLRCGACHVRMMPPRPLCCPLEHLPSPRKFSNVSLPVRSSQSPKARVCWGSDLERRHCTEPLPKGHLRLRSHRPLLMLP